MTSGAFKMRSLIILLLSLAGVILVSGCVSQQPADTIFPTGDVKEFTIRESNFKLSPANITVNKGDNVRITVVNDQGQHNLFVEGYEKRISVVSPGKSQVMEFVADRPGTFKMWCEVDAHRDFGMEGELTVLQT